MAVNIVPINATAQSLWREHPFYLHIQVLFTALILLTGAALLWSNYQQGRGIVLAAAEDVFERIERESAAQIVYSSAPIEAVVEWISNTPITEAGTLEARLQSLPALVSVLERHKRLESMYVGYYNGDFLLLRALRTEADRSRFEAPRHAEYAVQSIERSAGERVQFILLDAALNRISSKPPPAGYNYDPRTRPWFAAAMKSPDLIHTEPYAFFTTGAVGQTIARRADHGRAVVGADVTLTNLSETLKQARPTPSAELAVIDRAGNAIAYSDPGKMASARAAGKAMLTRVGELSPALGAAAADLQRFATRGSMRVDGREWVLRVIPTGPQDSGRYLAIAVPSDELLGAARALLERHVWLTLALLLATVPFVWWISRRIASNLKSLTEQAAAIRRFDFAKPPELQTRVTEIGELGDAMTQMRETIRKFLDISKALSAERNLDRLVERVLDEAHAAAGADASVVYLVNDEGTALIPAAQKSRTQSGQASALAGELSMSDAANPVVRAAIAESTTQFHELAPSRPFGLEFLDRWFDAMPLVLVTVPLLNRTGGTVGIVCLFLRGERDLPSLERLALVEAFAGSGAVAIDNQRLLAAQKALLDALIRLIAGAIDAKSPYTGGHCERVPDLTFMLTRAACDAKTGPFAAFDLDDDGWEALKIASGLHDCGKVTTPEYVVDKATKLETLYDRIHEVRMRFEVLKRDAEIACLKAIAGGADEARERAALASHLAKLDEEFAFVAQSNTGGEFMAPEAIARLKEIGTRTWQRTLDDRIGIAWEEGLRKARTPASALPAVERLLDDKPEHVLERGPADAIAADNPWGFKVNTPQHLYNRGELYNLTIARGTLTDEERYKINDHIVQTIVMLNQLPFPPHLKAVPELAGGHHEKMDGTGYPKRLARNDMSVPARIMAIADIFEALTASDRPYKKGKMLSEAVKIMGFMKKDQHIDPDLFDLFLESGVYRAYAERYLKSEFIDEIDVSAYVCRPAPAATAA